MDVGVLAVRYAKALLGYASDRGVAQEIYAQANVLCECFAQNPSLAKAVEDPLLSKEEKMRLLEAAVTCSGEAKDVVLRFFGLVIDHRREAYLASSMRSYMELYRKQENIVVVKITTAVPLVKEMEEKILAKVSSMLGKNIELQKEVDPAIEGGFIFDLDNYRLDASVAAQLRNIRRKLLDQNRRIV